MPNGGDNSIPVAANALGTIGTVLWCVQLLPQIWHNWRHKKTDGLPASMMMLWFACAIPFGVYMILQDVNIPLQIQPQLFAFLALVTYGQILYYHHNYSRTKVTVLVILAGLIGGGAEALFIFTLRIPYSKGITWPALLIGIIAAILLILGLVPAYLELWKRNGRVIGINWTFLTIDSMGALFSLLALGGLPWRLTGTFTAAQGSFDILGGILYLLVIFLEIGIFASHITWRWRNRNLIRAAKVSGRTVDELLEEREQQKPTATTHHEPLTKVRQDLESRGNQETRVLQSVEMAKRTGEP